MAWLKDKRYNPQSFIAFGDSPSDSAMADTFSANGTDTTFVFVGKPDKLKLTGDEPYNTVIMNGRYSTDTAAFLREM